MLVGNVHLMQGGAKDIQALLKRLQQEEGIETAGNPDLLVREYKSFGIDDARELSEKAAARAIGSAQSSPRLRPAQRVFVVVADSLTHEAQNALLKTLEEAPGNALFFFIVPNPEALLPTVRSRAQQVVLPRTVLGTYQGPSLVDVERFIGAKAAERLDMLKPLLEKGDDDTRDFGAILGFLAALERALEKEPTRLGPVYRARKYIGDRGALVKPLLEQVALLI